MIHQYKLNGYNIVLDINSGSVHVVDEVAYDIIGMYEDNSNEAITKAMLEKYKNKDDVNASEISDCLNDIKFLKDEGKLFASDNFINEAISTKSKNTIVKALCLHVAHTCNLNCSYCFARQGNYNGKEAIMSFEVGKQALDFLIANSGPRQNLEVDFFGGEPLMNWDIVKQLVVYARSQEKKCGKTFRFTFLIKKWILLF